MSVDGISADAVCLSHTTAEKKTLHISKFPTGAPNGWVGGCRYLSACGEAFGGREQSGLLPPSSPGAYLSGAGSSLIIARYEGVATIKAL